MWPPSQLRKGDAPSAQRALDHCAPSRRSDPGDLQERPVRSRRRARRGQSQGTNIDRSQAERSIARSARRRACLATTTKPSELAESSYSTFPQRGGRPRSCALARGAGKDQEALQYLADAFTIAGLHSADVDGSGDRARMGELYRKLHGSEAGLGDLVLKAYDDTTSLTGRAPRRAAPVRSQRPAQGPDAVHALRPGRRQIAALLAARQSSRRRLLGHLVRSLPPQHPLYDQVKSSFKDTGDVVFLSVDTDEDHSLVKPFIESAEVERRMCISKTDCSACCSVSSIPTTIIFGKQGEVVSRMIGFLPIALSPCSRTAFNEPWATRIRCRR